MSTKVYYGYRSSVSRTQATVVFLRRSLLRRSARLFRNVESLGVLRDVVKDVGEVGFHLWHDPRRKIVLYSLFGPHGLISIPKRNLPSGLKEFSYWDNSDPPANVSSRIWKTRGKIWDEVALDDGRWDERSTNIVLSHSDLFPLVRMIPALSKKMGLSAPKKSRRVLGK